MAQREVRIQGVSLRLKKRIPISLRDIFGIGPTRALEICEKAGVSINTKTEELSADEVKTLAACVDEYIVEGELRNFIKQCKKKLTDRRTYRGLRHLVGLPIRKRTKTNAMTCKKRRGKRVIVDFNKDGKKK